MFHQSYKEEDLGPPCHPFLEPSQMTKWDNCQLGIFWTCDMWVLFFHGRFIGALFSSIHRTSGRRGHPLPLHLRSSAGDGKSPIDGNLGK